MDIELLKKIAAYRMPFGKYSGRLLLQIPDEYFIWFSHKGYPEGELGEIMQIVYQLKVDGLTYLFDTLR
ncbi:MAG: hypothetical protein A2015_15120 [Spirochaetes bacterium GWF1_31_7]|nr:MAG: hypothetical protein A2Y30_11545 [Spirochaetes bacterium GWE1_32_154]OHD51154.1 MAG: hypothetical protein A2Y29_01085 [Spirochaetes bacterium GWE2_31_10]OHD52073.1 MAG: hypothetical protein A2015_15120 [Spirochaetes bacterium GWF1_31_7]OHD80851.1 MAG: hypothetical protein A2355_14995 [Spirochaetes bacterium RIFOXYB1_FULL_32_8]HBD96468.1 hypothetical protein [Spirochaetia bacterium]